MRTAHCHGRSRPARRTPGSPPDPLSETKGGGSMRHRHALAKATPGGTPDRGIDNPNSCCTRSTGSRAGTEGHCCCIRYNQY